MQLSFCLDKDGSHAGRELWSKDWLVRTRNQTLWSSIVWSDEFLFPVLLECLWGYEGKNHYALSQCFFCLLFCICRPTWDLTERQGYLDRRRIWKDSNVQQNVWLCRLAAVVYNFLDQSSDFWISYSMNKLFSFWSKSLSKLSHVGFPPFPIIVYTFDRHSSGLVLVSQPLQSTKKSKKITDIDQQHSVWLHPIAHVYMWLSLLLVLTSVENQKESRYSPSAKSRVLGLEEPVVTSSVWIIRLVSYLNKWQPRRDTIRFFGCSEMMMQWQK